MEYAIKIYLKDEENLNRFVLGNINKNPLFVIGLNPSTADENKPDPTITKVMGFAEGNGFDSFVMLNLYPQRATKPSDLAIDICEINHGKNITEIENILNSVSKPKILASWGEKIRERKYLSHCIKSIHEVTKNKNAEWLKIGELTKSGHPRHPLYASYNLGISSFDINKYIEKIK